ncbi:MAG: efflux RND transporter periplasmic adaptor subunit [Bacteroidota bacterium]
MDEKIEKKKPIGKIILMSAGIIGLGFLLMSIYKNTKTSKLNVDQARILTDTIHTGVFKEFITIFGTVEPFKTVYIDAIESGRIEERYLEDGTMVEKGEPILKLSNVDLQLSVLNQEAQIVDQINTIRYQSIVREQQSLNIREQALDVQFQLDLLEKRTRRNRDLIRDSVIAVVDLEETQDEYEHLQRRQQLLEATIRKDSLAQAAQQNQMETSLDLMRRNLEFAKNSLDNLVIKAPISGQISSLDSEVGELLNQGARIAQIDVLDNFKIRARIDEFYISRIFLMQTGSFTMDGETYELSIKKIYPEVSNGTFDVDLVFTNGHPKTIKRGQTISLKLSLSDETESRLLAKGGFFQETGGNWVYVLGTDGVARKRNIRLGRQNPNFYEVQDGLQDGDIVIVSSYENYGEKDELVVREN